MKKYLIIMATLLFIACESEEANPMIRGRVKDPGGNPVSNSKIVISLDTYESQGNISLAYNLPYQSEVLIWIEGDCSDDTVSILQNENQSAGLYNLVWNSLNRDSLLITNGRYTFHLKSDSLNDNSHFISAGDYINYSYLEIEPLAVTDENGYFELEQNCLPFDYEWNRTDEEGNVLSTVKLSRKIVIRAFHPVYNRVSTDTLTVDETNGLEVNLKFSG